MLPREVKVSTNFPSWQAVFYHFRSWRLQGLWFCLFRVLHAVERERVGRDAYPSTAVMDAQTVETVEESARVSGYDGHACMYQWPQVTSARRYSRASDRDLRHPSRPVGPRRCAQTLGGPPVPRAQSVWPFYAGAMAGIAVRRERAVSQMSGVCVLTSDVSCAQVWGKGTIAPGGPSG
jgi:hypothetical protein